MSSPFLSVVVDDDDDDDDDDTINYGLAFVE